MKTSIAMGSMTLLTTLLMAISTPAHGEVYVEYSRIMVEALEDKANRRFAENVLRGESIALYGLHAEGGGRTTRALGEPPFREVMECFSRLPAVDTCEQNDLLQRRPDHPVDIGVLDTPSLTPTSDTAILFTSYNRAAIDEMKTFIEKKRRPVHLLYFGDETDKPLFYLSFGPIKNQAYLAGIYPFHRNKTQSRCNARCGWRDEKRGIKDRSIDFLQHCFSGRLPGRPEKLTYRYPDRPLLTNQYLDCPADTFPPRPRLGPDLERLDLGMSESGYYRALQPCLTQKGYASDSSPRATRNVGIKIAVDLTLAPVQRAVYDKLPLSIREMFSELSGESVDSYPLPVNYTVLGQFEECE
uniref:Uncharacterized protein n=1 Tax=Candidatus Kentrum eta TaxID=2126337 RepID=A0A450V1A0_9GAMM|nr:MAG: hypothetical protein BECKH772A_GA0070896_100268 [Candidatus Kentron sp. H]VFJ92017.1 MAG: hypothetical protein BECKH772B_GA0070898_100248 [Candidatus Kentron sp. H]VFJ98604.1 MAG: hypothetical protein BECKH772C_GA0070978_100238 [Candidatus Kentron sp. H]